MAKLKHIHRYTKVNIGMNGKKYVVFRCNLPGCTHYIREDLARDIVCLCNRCDKLMALTPLNMRRSKPHCEECTKRKNPVIHERIKELVDGPEDKLNKILEEMGSLSKSSVQVE